MAGLAEFKRPQPSSTERTKSGGRKKREPIDTGTPELAKRHKHRAAVLDEDANRNRGGVSSSRKRKPREAIDTGTPELGKRHKLKVERGVGVVRLRNLDGTPLDRLLYQELITPEEYSTLDDFYADMYRAGMVTLKARPMWKIMGSTQAISDQSEDQAHLSAMVRKLCTVVRQRAGAAALQALLDGASGTCSPVQLRLAAKALASAQALEVRRLHRR